MPASRLRENVPYPAPLPPFLALALKRAARSECRYRVGAVLVKGSRVLGQAANLPRNSPWVDFKNATWHAEEAVLRRFSPPRGAVLYVARLDRRGRPALARPCPRCQLVLAANGIRTVHYTAASGPQTLFVSTRPARSG
ncbi:hypothetical protein ACIBEA_44255 [Streptomyces sp. NPDC051555]|uniref:hypothetical protein n=1 Tax=Streptomyces sp. NPDC051555 TaxID=3365657 RepID=UPI0037A15571